MGFEVGKVIGDYTVEGSLGRGGLGTVYRVRHTISQREEAMKVLHTDLSDAAEPVVRFKREVRLLASLNHPNIARLNTAFYFEGQLVMMMELVEGEDLRSLSRRSRIATLQLLDYAAQALRALDYAHARGVVHRDIKPSNMMVSPGGLMKVVDFGIAQQEASTELTLTGSVIGSPFYMSPEQVRGEKATPQSDIYSFGASLYELFAGEAPVKGRNSYELMMAHLHQVPKPLRELRPDLPPYLSHVLARTLQKEPAHRFAKAVDLLEALAAGDRPDADLTATLAPVSSSPRASTSELNRLPGGSGPLSQPLEPLVRHLATFIGPIAKITVIRLSKKTANLDELYQEAAKQIDNPTDRQRFLKTRPCY